MLKKKIIELFTQKIFTKLSKIWVRDPGSLIQGSKGHRIRIRNTVSSVVVLWIVDPDRNPHGYGTH
jgi:hypothetical protein